MNKLMIFALTFLTLAGFSDESTEVVFGTDTFGIRLDENGILQTLEDSIWTPYQSAELPQQVLYPDYTPRTRPFNDLATYDGVRILGTTAFDVVESTDGGESWGEIMDRSIIAKHAYLTTAAFSPLVPDTIAVGTSFHGLYLSDDGGATWEEMEDSFDFLSPGGNYQETFNDLVFSPTIENILYAALGVDGHVLRINIATGEVEDLGFNANDSRYLTALKVTSGNGEGLLAEGEKGVFQWDGEIWTQVSTADPIELSPEKQLRMDASRDQFGIYLSSYHAGDNDLLEGHLDFVEDRGMNALVVDFKDDQGRLTYNSNVALAQEMGAITPRFDVQELVDKVHQRGFYLIARVVVFKDRRLFTYNDNELALWDDSRNAPWGFFHEMTRDDGTTYMEQREFWVDTYNEDVWAYNIAIAKELQDLGVDEIQFDYIRFPSDGPIQDITHRHHREHMSRTDALESFMIMARESLEIPISTDVFGFNGWYEMDYLGQNIAVLGKYVDAISPMLYPSHFPAFFYGDDTYLEKARKIYKGGSDRTHFVANGLVHSRPYVQAFLIGSELNMEYAEYTSYLKKQLQGIQESAGNGFLLWNASNRYYMVPEPLTDFTGIE